MIYDDLWMIYDDLEFRGNWGCYHNGNSYNWMIYDDLEVTEVTLFEETSKWLAELHLKHWSYPPIVTHG